jgi:protocatechuate 3,4-dioxygenase beta subunit
MAVAVSRGTLVALGAAFALTACSGNAESPAAGTPSTSVQTASSGAARSATGCPSPAPHRISAASVLSPGPSHGLPRSQAAGERLVIAAVVLDPDCRPASGASVNVWHTDAAGRYGPDDGGSGEIECCYYQGTVRTDRAGGFRLETVRPGRYDQRNAPPAHIHLEIHHASGGLMAELVFARDSTPPAPAGHDGTIPVTLHEVHDAHGDAWYGEIAVVLGA